MGRLSLRRFNKQVNWIFIRKGMIKMTNVQSTAIKYIHGLSESKLHSALDYLRYLYEKEDVLNDFGSKLSRPVDKKANKKTTASEEVLYKAGLAYEMKPYKKSLSSFGLLLHNA